MTILRVRRSGRVAWSVVLVVVLGAVAAAGGAFAQRRDGGGPDGGSAAPAGEWTLLRFDGGPPSLGQRTYVVRVDPAAGRRVRVTLTRAGVARDRACEAVVRDDRGWAELATALSSPELAEAFAHPDRLPRLMLDAPYFACERAGVRVAVSDSAPSDAAAPRETAALRRVAQAYDHVRAAVLALPACRALR